MIYLYSGTPGSGKSLHAAQKIYWWLKFKRTVICNFPIKLEAVGEADKIGKFLYLDNLELTPQKLVEISQEHFAGQRVKEEELLLIIDEAQILFNAREWGKRGRDAWLKFFTQHRKFGYRIILIAQFDTMLDKQIRSVIEYEVKHRKITNYGMRGKIMSWIVGTHVAVTVWYPMKERVESEFFRAHKMYYQLYDTYAVF